MTRPASSDGRDQPEERGAGASDTERGSRQRQERPRPGAATHRSTPALPGRQAVTVWNAAQPAVPPKSDRERGDAGPGGRRARAATRSAQPMPSRTRGPVHVVDDRVPGPEPSPLVGPGSRRPRAGVTRERRSGR